MRIERAPEQVQPMFDFPDDIPTADYRPAHDIRVAVEILCRAMQREIEPQFGWAKVDRTCERVVDDRDEIIGLCKLHNCAKIRYLQQRIAHRFNIDRAGFGAKLRLPRFSVAAVDEIGGKPEIRKIFRDEVVRSAVEAI